MKKYFIISLLFIAINAFCLDNQHKVDSLIKLLPSIKSDTGKITLLLNIANTYRNFETKNASKYCNQALALAKKIDHNKQYDCYVVKGLINYRLGNHQEAISNYFQVINNTDNHNRTKGKAYINIGNLYADIGRYDSSIIFYNNAALVFDNVGDKKYKAGVLNNIGTIYSDLGDFDKAIDYYTKALKTHEEYGNLLGKAAAIENIGIIYYFQQNFNKALEYFKTAQVIFEEVGVLDKQANALNNIASMAVLMKDNETAITYFKEAEAIFDQMDNKSGQAEINQNLAQIYFTSDNPKEGIRLLKKAIKTYQELGIVKGEGKCFKALGEHYFNKKNYTKSIANYLKAKSLLEPLGVKNDLRNLYQSLADAYSKAKNYKQSSTYFEKFIAINDTIFNREKSHQIAEMQEKYDSEAKQQKIELQQIEKEKLNADLTHQTKQKIWFGIGLALALISLLVAYRGYRHKKQANNIITGQKNIVEEKNKEIIDSINYAKRIQNALLSSENQVSEHLPEHFVFFNPKDIVSGDFYWTFEKQNYLYIAVADCTGHGVPGAFLTMLGTAFLNEITAKEELLSPAQILDELRTKFIKELKQTGEDGENKDGMDMSLIRLDINTKELQWSGANNPLWIISQSKFISEINPQMLKQIQHDDAILFEIKSDKQPISYYPDAKPFTNHEIKLAKEDLIYLFTDGYADQFGGEKGKKFKYKPFKELLISLSSKSMTSQKETLENRFTQWKGDLEQIDDVCIIGVKI